MSVEDGGFEEIVQGAFPPSPALVPRVVYQIPTYQEEERAVAPDALVLAFEIERFLAARNSRTVCYKPDPVELQAEPQADDEAAVSHAQRLGALVAALALVAGLAAMPAAAGRTAAAETTAPYSSTSASYEREAGLSTGE